MFVFSPVSCQAISLNVASFSSEDSINVYPFRKWLVGYNFYFDLPPAGARRTRSNRTIHVSIVVLSFPQTARTGVVGVV